MNYQDQYQAWMQTVRQQQLAYDQRIQAQMGDATYHQALNYPRNYPLIGQMANALTGPAGAPNNPSTALFGSSNQQAANLMQAYFMANAPGGNTIGLPTDGDSIGGNQINSSNALIAALLGRSGVG